MKWNEFPRYKIPIDYVYYDDVGNTYVNHIGWIVTPDIEILKDDHRQHLELVGR